MSIAIPPKMIKLKSKIKILITLLLALFVAHASFTTASQVSSITGIHAREHVTSLPGYGKVNGMEFAGYLPALTPTCQTPSCYHDPANLFYWYVTAASPSKRPVIIWLNGGPGSASLYGFLVEHGPYYVNRTGGLSSRRYAWSNLANYIVIDQPAGVGLSYVDAKHTVSSESEAIQQLYHGIQALFARYPALAKQPVYLAGESYAGKYLPELATLILQGNNAGQPHRYIPLRGILLGDAWVNPKVQQEANAEYAYAHGLIDENTRRKVNTLYQHCADAIDKQTPSTRAANNICMKMQELIAHASGITLANIQTSTVPDETRMIHYLNRQDVRLALHVDPRVGRYESWSRIISHRLEIGEQDSVAHLFAPLLQAGVRILIYNGLEDGKDSNFISTDKWLSQLDWSDKQAFAAAPTCIWRVNHQVAGYVRSTNNLTQVKIRGAGHMAPPDKPAVLFRLVQTFMQNKAFC